MTKVGELKLLEQIAGLIKSAGEDSYIHDTFAGIVDVCRSNIENDFGDHPVQDLNELRERFNAEVRMHDETKRQLAQAQELWKQSMDEVDSLRKQIKKVEDERDAMCDSADGLSEIIDEMEKETIMLKAELKQYIRGDIIAEVRTGELHRVIIERGIYGEFLVGTQEHITADSSCKWEYMQNGWRWHDLEYRKSEEDARQRFADYVRLERED